MKKIYLVLMICGLLIVSCKTNNIEQPYKTESIPSINQCDVKKLFSEYGDISEYNIKAFQEWSTWSRSQDALTITSNIDCFDFIYTKTDDYSISVSDAIEVTEGQTYIFSIDAKLIEGKITPCFLLEDKDKNVIDWVSGYRDSSNSDKVSTIISLVTVPKNVAFITPRIVGSMNTQCVITNPIFISFNKKDVNRKTNLENEILSVSFSSETNSFTVTDKRLNKTREQYPTELSSFIYLENKLVKENDIQKQVYSILDIADNRLMVFSYQLVNDRVLCSLKLDENSKNTVMSDVLYFPSSFKHDENEYLVLPINEGMRFNATDQDMPLQDLVAFSGHGICMPFWGSTNGQDAYITIVETPDDCALHLSRTDKINTCSPGWYAQKGVFQDERRWQYVFINDGDHNEIAKEYREYAKEKGLVKTFEQKKIERGQKAAKNIDALLGSANIWSWDNSAYNLAKKITDSGITRIIWSNGLPAEEIDKLNTLNNSLNIDDKPITVLTSTYDIYQDVMNPKNFSKIQYTSNQWPTEAYPSDINLEKNGTFTQAWGIEKKNGEGMIYCVSICDAQAPLYARKRIENELLTKSYGSRFIDTVTASALRECYSLDHPMNRTQSRESRYELLSVVSLENSLVCGSETGMDFCVPVCDYFEGMLSLGQYRVEDAGRQMQKIYTTVPSQITDFQVNEERRLPLWELVYHDCCVAMWYWGDYNNKIPLVWDKRDLFNALYATPPMYMFTESMFDAQRDQFVSSWLKIEEILQLTKGEEMVSFEYVDGIINKQKTVFANGVQVIVDFNLKTIQIEN